MAARSTRIVRNGCGYVYQIPCEDKVWLEEFLYKNQTAIHLLLDCSAGTSYENFSHSLIELETAINELAISECMQFQIKQSMDTDFIHIISCCFINSILSISLRKHMSGWQQYQRILGDYFSFYEAGWKHLLNKAISQKVTTAYYNHSAPTNGERKNRCGDRGFRALKWISYSAAVLRKSRPPFSMPSQE